MRRILLLLLAAGFVSAEWHDYAAVRRIVDTLLTNYPSIITKQVFDTTDGGRECYAVKISDNPAVDETEPELAFDAGTHGGELVGQEVLFRFMRDLCMEYGSDSLVRALVDSREIWIYPLMDPDSRDALSRSGLNRDWGFLWGDDMGGSRPFQYPETRAGARWVMGNQFVLHQTHHDGGTIVAYPWGYSHTKSTDSQAIDFLANLYESLSPYLTVGFWGARNTGTGALFSHGVMGTVSWTIEVNGTGQPANGDSVVNVRYASNKPAMREMVRRAGEGIWGLVTDSATGRPLPATVWVSQGNGALRPASTDPLLGDYHKFLVPGTYDVTVRANGYAERTVRGVTVPAGNALRVDAGLSPQDRHWGLRTPIVAVTGEQIDSKTHSYRMLWKADGIGYSLGKGGHVVLDMDGALADVPNSPDFTVYEAGPESEGYAVDVAANWSGPWIPIGSDTGTAAFDIAGKASAYRYIRVRDDGDGDLLAADAGIELDAVEAFTIRDATPPSAPTGVAASGVSESAIRVSWRPATDAESDIAGYRLYRDGQPLLELPDTFFMNTDLAEQESHSYRVAALNSRGIESPLSLEVMASTLTDTVAPLFRYLTASRTDSLTLFFSEPLSRTSAENAARYTISGGVSVTRALLLPDGRSVSLALSGMREMAYCTLRVAGVTDRAAVPNPLPAGTAATVYVLSGLAGHWRFEEGAGDTAHDASGHRRHGFLNPGADWVAGAQGGGLRLDGVNGFVRVPDDSGLDFGRRAFSAAFWVYADTLRARTVLLDKYDADGGYRMILSDTDRDRLKIIRGTTYASGVQSDDAVLSAKTWIHVAFAADDSGRVSIFVNGVAAGSGTLAASDATSAAGFFMGQKSLLTSTAVNLRGRLDEVCLFNRAIDSETVAFLAGKGPGMAQELSLMPPASRMILQPNPFNLAACVTLEGLVARDQAVLKIFDSRGRMVEHAVLQGHSGPRRSVVWDGSRQASGIYLFRVSAGGMVWNRKAVLVR